MLMLMLALDHDHARAKHCVLTCLAAGGNVKVSGLLPAEGLVFGAPVPVGLASLLGALSPVLLAALILPLLSLGPTSLVSVSGCRLDPDHENYQLWLCDVQVSLTTTPSNQK